MRRLASTRGILQSQLLTGCSRLTRVPLSFCANLGQNSKNSKRRGFSSRFCAGLAEASFLSSSSLSPPFSLSSQPSPLFAPCPASPPCPSSCRPSFPQRLDRFFICQPCFDLLHLVCRMPSRPPFTIPALASLPRSSGRIPGSVRRPSCLGIQRPMPSRFRSAPRGGAPSAIPTRFPSKTRSASICLRLGSWRRAGMHKRPASMRGTGRRLVILGPWSKNKAVNAPMLLKAAQAKFDDSCGQQIVDACAGCG